MFGQGQGAASLVAVVIDNYRTEVVVAHTTVAGLRRETQRRAHDDTNS